ncbi:hypothetical protein [Runella sp.]|uniref:hypothetical protein n=1 Tax=Runella sp. TaxID=1960881 RepID=UPI003D1434F2
MKRFALLSLLAVFSCNKNQDPTPIPVATPVCNISSETGVNNSYKLEYLYNTSGSPEGVNISTKNTADGQLKPVSTARYTYENGRLVKVVDGAVEEVLEYSPGGALTRLTVAKTVEPAYVNYTLNFETDANQRITKVMDSMGKQTTIKRDAQGNITETLTVDTKTGQELYRIELSGYDNRKSVYDSFKGWSFSVLSYYADYVKFPLFTTGAGGNAVKRIDYVAGKAFSETTYTYTYTSNGFPLTEQSFTRFSDGSGVGTNGRTFAYTNCK